jgi:hypothetical protein
LTAVGEFLSQIYGMDSIIINQLMFGITDNTVHVPEWCGSYVPIVYGVLGGRVLGVPGADERILALSYPASDRCSKRFLW